VGAKSFERHWRGTATRRGVSEMGARLAKASWASVGRRSWTSGGSGVGEHVREASACTPGKGGGQWSTIP